MFANLGRQCHEAEVTGVGTPDQVLVDLVIRDLCESTGPAGFVLDGFPATVRQVLLEPRGVLCFCVTNFSTMTSLPSLL